MKKWLIRYLLFTGIALHAGIAIWWITLPTYDYRKSPDEIIQFAKNKYQKRYPTLFKTLDPALTAIQKSQAPRQSMKLPALDRWRFQGASAERNFAFQHYNKQGNPLSGTPGEFNIPEGYKKILVRNSQQLKQAILKAKAGTYIELQAGNYRLKDRSFPSHAGGTAKQPIYLRAKHFGDVQIALNALEGFHIKHPYWVFENLDILGACREDSYCEHAFHIVGDARNTVIRNSRMRNFNAPVKVNSFNQANPPQHPDNGLIEYVTVNNNWARKTNNSVTLLNIDTANYWRVRKSVIADFSKNGGDYVSYAAFMKGNSRGGVFEQNLVICEQNVHNKGSRVGLSFGGGGTGKQYCRHGSCSTEHTDGIIRNNVILNCTADVGIYLNKSANTQVHNNLLAFTRGIDVRFASSNATVFNNISDSKARERNKGILFDENNLYSDSCIYDDNCAMTDWFINPTKAQFEAKTTKHQQALLGSPAANDFCGTPRQSKQQLGPFEYPTPKGCIPTIEINTSHE